jgi:hypothetical protein
MANVLIVIWQHTPIKNVLDVQLKEIRMTDNDSIRRDIVLQVSRQIFIALINRSEKGISYATPESCFDIGELWADAQIAYCEKNDEAVSDT